MRKKRTIEIQGDFMPERIEIEAMVGPFAIHATFKRTWPAEYPFTVTHVKTGRAAAGVRSVEDGRRVAKALRVLDVPWTTLTPGQMLSRYKRKIPEVRALVARIGGITEEAHK